jgi:hypothetical protein
MFAHGNRPAGRHHPPLPDTPCRSAQKPEVDAILGEPQARKTAWGFRFGQSDSAHIVSVEARTIASICPRRGKPRPAEGRQSLRPAHVFGNLVAFQFFSVAQLPSFVPPQSADRHELIGKSGDDFEEHHHRCDRYRSVGIPSSAGAAEVLGPGAAVGAWYGTAPVGSPPPTARLPYYEYGPWAAYERPVPYPNRPYTPPPRYANPAPLFCQWEPGELVWNGRGWFRTRVQICD